MGLAAVLGVLHLVVDAATVTVLFRATGGHSLSPPQVLGWIVAYDVVAFGLQPVIGWLQDRWGTPRQAMLTGLLLTLGAVTLLEIGRTPVALALSVAVAAAGNALFHLGAGARVLARGLDRAAPLGLLVAPGALGLGIGIWFGQHADAGPASLVSPPIMLAALAVALMPTEPATNGRVPRRVPQVAQDVLPGVLFLLMTSIAIRSLVGMSASKGYTSTLLLWIPVAAFAGKLLGGLAADRFGWVRTTVCALAVSAPLLAFTYPHAAVLLVGLLVFQMTMPVTLVAIVRLMPNRLATGFGLSCLALLIGSLPVTTGWGGQLTAKPILGLWVVLSAFAASVGLTQMGMRWRARRDGGSVAVEGEHARAPAR